MSQDESRADPLLSAIGELRQELIRWIDSQLGLLREWGTRLETTAPLGAGGEPRVKPGVVTDLPAPPAGLRDPAEPAPNGDARHRLDVLARQLGERLRQSESARKGPE